MNHRPYQPGEAFVPGELWLSPHGKLYRVARELPGRSTDGRRQLQLVREPPAGRPMTREWDAVQGWTLQSPSEASEPATPSLPEAYVAAAKGITGLDPADLAQRCAEVLHWQRTGQIDGSALIALAQSMRLAGDDDELRRAEALTAKQAMLVVVALASSRTG